MTADHATLIHWGTSHGRRGVPHRRQLDCLFNCLFRLTSKKISKPALLALCEGNPSVDSPHKGPVEQALTFPCHDVIIISVVVIITVLFLLIITITITITITIIINNDVGTGYFSLWYSFDGEYWFNSIFARVFFFFLSPDVKLFPPFSIFG